MNTIEVTRQEALEALNVLVMSFIEDGRIDSDSLAIAEYVVVADIQFRDYMLGMPYDYGIQHLINLSNTILVTLEEGSKFAVALNTMQASWLYEAGETEKAEKALLEALKGDVNYPLAHLLTRVIGTGAPKETFSRCRNDLHLVVLAGIKEDGDSLITRE